MKKRIVAGLLCFAMLITFAAFGMACGEDSSLWLFDDSGHWKESRGGRVEDKASHIFGEPVVSEPTFESEGFLQYTCTVCGYVKTEKGEEAIDHTYSTEWSHDENSHWLGCLDEGYTHLKKGEAPHDDALEEVLIPATDTETGLVRYTCSVCRFVYEKPIPVLGKIVVTCLSGTQNAYTLTGNTLTFTSLSEDSVYSVSGEHTGNIVIDVGNDYKFELELHGLTLSSDTESPITVVSGNKVTLSAKKGYTNTVTDLRDAVDANDETLRSAAIDSAVDLDIEGKGSLTVESKYNKGIHSKDDLTVKNLTLTVKCTDNALKGNDSVTVSGGTVTLIATQGDGIKTENSSISEKGKQKGTVTVAACDLTIHAACDGIDAAYNVVIEEDSTKLSIYTDRYSEHSEDVTDTPSEENDAYYIRFNNKNYRYSVKFYNSDSDYKWVDASLAKTVSDGRNTYYYHSFPMQEGYSSLKIFMYSTSQSQGQEEDYTLATDYITWNSLYDTFALSSRGNTVSYNWTNYTKNMGGGPGGMGGFPGGGPGGMGDGNADKGDYSTKGIKADNEILISGGTVTVRSYDDAIHANIDTTLENGASPTGNITVSGGFLTLYTNDDGIHADGKLTVTGGKIHVTNSYEGLEGNLIEIAGGDVSITSSDDGINSPATEGTVITLSGGTVYLYAKGDGIDSNSRTAGGILFSGASVVVINTSGGNAAIDSERGYTYTAGYVLAIGSSGGMTNETTNCPNFSSIGTKKNLSLSESGILTVTVDGELLVSVKMPASFSSTTVFLGAKDAVMTTTTSSNATFDENGVAWNP